MEEFLAATAHRRLADSLGIERNVAATSGALFLAGLGKEVWKKFLPKYLESLGASVAVVGLVGTSDNYLDAPYQYPGCWLRTGAPSSSTPINSRTAVEEFEETKAGALNSPPRLQEGTLRQ